MKTILLMCSVLFLSGNLVFSQDFLRLCWSDEFDGSVLDQTKWEYQLGTGSDEGLSDWGNNEQQYYTRENVAVKDGMLIITAKRESKNNKPFTSARLLTRGKSFTTYGRIEAKISVSAIEGLWPAFWMLPQNSPYGTWAASGEIDIFEAKGRLADQYSGTIHYGGIWPRNVYSGTGDYRFPEGKKIDDFHVYAVEWKEGEISWFCDNILVKKLTSWYSENGTFPAPFNTNFYILLNLAVGGNFDENKTPPSGFTFGEMKIDYVRVYKGTNDCKDVDNSIEQMKNTTEISILQLDDVITINAAPAIKTAKLYSASGQLSNQIKNTNIVRTSTLSKGSYMLKVEDITGLSETFKVILR